MKVVVKSEGRNFTIPIPMFMLTSGVKVSNYIAKKVAKNGEPSEDTKRYLEMVNCIDLDLILKALKELKGYKGLNLVEVSSNDGTYVLIKI